MIDIFSLDGNNSFLFLFPFENNISDDELTTIHVNGEQHLGFNRLEEC